MITTTLVVLGAFLLGMLFQQFGAPLLAVVVKALRDGTRAAWEFDTALGYLQPPKAWPRPPQHANCRCELPSKAFGSIGQQVVEELRLGPAVKIVRDTVRDEIRHWMNDPQSPLFPLGPNGNIYSRQVMRDDVLRWIKEDHSALRQQVDGIVADWVAKVIHRDEVGDKERMQKIAREVYVEERREDPFSGDQYERIHNIARSEAHDVVRDITNAIGQTGASRSRAGESAF